MPSGRSKGCKPTINKRPDKIDREEILDGLVCPDCGEPLSEKSSNMLEKVVQMVHVIKTDVLFKRPRRWCKNCKKQKVRPIPGVQNHARRSINHSATMTLLNMQGLSHARSVTHCKDTMMIDVSRVTALHDRDGARQNTRAAARCHKEKDTSRSCLVKTIGAYKHLKNFCQIIMRSRQMTRIQDWLHIGSRSQMCIAHQIRLVKEASKYNNPKGDALRFLQKLL